MASTTATTITTTAIGLHREEDARRGLPAGVGHLSSERAVCELLWLRAWFLPA